ncbi:uncharacterized protein [Drosophila tropicalis]|uniref:uncharacterized protein isoform X3 n=1 Tax=Drosophila tropicalis TaxID=46794 RepID=UPI0035ABA1FE
MIVYGQTQRFLWVTVFLVFHLFLALDTPRGNIFALASGTDDDDASVEVEDNAASFVQERKKTGGRRTGSDHKFKFRKIERVYVDDYIEDENDDDNDESNENPDEDYTRSNDREKSRNKKYQSTETDNELSDEVAHDDEDDSTSIFSNILDLFVASEPEGEPETPTNNIITWLQWIGEKISNGRPTKGAEEPPVVDEPGWLAYLNRWPFNMIMSDDGDGESQQNQKRSHHSKSDDDGGGPITSNPLPDDYFDQILHSLPSFMANFSNTWTTGACQQDLQIFQKQMRAYKIWTLQMIDATGKVSSGLLRGYINQFGDFDLCTQTSAVAKARTSSGSSRRIHGKYCLAQIEMRTKISELKAPLHMLQGFGLWNSHISNPKHFVPRYTVANWGVCIPNACSSQVVQEIMENNLRIYNNTGIKFYIRVEEDNCSLKRKVNYIKLLRNDRMFGLSILALITLGSACIFAYFWEKRDWLTATSGRVIKALWPSKPVDSENDAGEEKPSPVTESSEEPHFSVAHCGEMS